LSHDHHLGHHEHPKTLKNHPAGDGEFAVCLSKSDQETARDRRPSEVVDYSRLANMSTALTGKAVAPFLKEYIPVLYAPIGKADNVETSKRKDPNSKYCYRHRPDSKCRRAADESKMVMIQSVYVLHNIRSNLVRH
jgi:F-box/WD-40 domain protein MET30